MKLRRTWYDIFVNVICIGLLVGIFLYLYLSWNTIPDKIPGHYNAAGVMDRWGNKSELLFTPITVLVMYIGITLVESFPQIWNTGIQITEANRERVYRILKNLIGTVKTIVVVMFIFITLNQSLSKPFPQWFLPVFLILMFGTILLFILKLIKAK